MNKEYMKRYKVENNFDELEKKKIIKENFNLPVNEIKKIIKQKYPDITNKEMLKLIGEINKSRSLTNLRISLKNKNQGR